MGPVKEPRDPNRQRSAATLKDDLQAYAAQAMEEARKVAASAKSFSDNLKEWGARAEFRSAQVLYDELGQEMPALKILGELAAKWPNTRVLSDGAEYQINKLVTRGQTLDAIKLLEEFRREHPERAEQLIRLVVQQIQARITKLRGNREARAELDAYRNVYYTFAKDLFERAEAKRKEQEKDSSLDPKVRERSLDEWNRVRQMLASALLEKGYADAGALKEQEAQQFYQEALDVFQKCEAHDSENRKKEGQRLKAVFGSKAQAIGIGDVTLEYVKEAKQRYLADLKKYGVAPAGVSGPAEIDKAIAAAEAATTAEQKEERIKGAVSEVRDAYLGVCDFLKNRMPESASRRKICEQLDAEFAVIVESIVRCDVTLQHINDLRDKYLAVLKQYDIYTEAISGPTEMNTAIKFAEAAPSAEEQKKRLAVAVDKVRDAYLAIGDALERTLTIDPGNLLGLARSYRALGKYDKAIEYYKKLAERVDPVGHPDMFWKVELETCEGAVEGFRNDKLAMAALVRRIRQLRDRDPGMGGLFTKFAAVETQAGSLAGQAPEPTTRPGG